MSTITARTVSMVPSLALLLTLLPAMAIPASGDDGCGDPGATNAACPDDPETARYIRRVTGTTYGASILLTEAGVDLGRDCDGAARIVAMASDLYARIPADRRLRDDLLWANPGITREVFGHAWAAELGVARGNPVDIVFGDYTGDGDTWQAPIWNGPLGRVLALLGCDG